LFCPSHHYSLMGTVLACPWLALEAQIFQKLIKGIGRKREPWPLSSQSNSNICAWLLAQNISKITYGSLKATYGGWSKLSNAMVEIPSCFFFPPKCDVQWFYPSSHAYPISRTPQMHSNTSPTCSGGPRGRKMRFRVETG